MVDKAPEQAIDEHIKQPYAYGFTTNIETDTLPPGLDEEVIRFYFS